MVFSSLVFLYIFFPFCILLYFALPGLKLRNLSLLVTSLFFYAWGEPVWVLLLFFSSIVDYINGLIIEAYRGKVQAKLAVAWCLVFNLGVLALFKYAGFLAMNLKAVTGLDIPVPDHHLPIGISFYTFQTISYIIDVYRGEVKAAKSFVSFLLFISLFHQLVAGPIVRYVHIAAEIEGRKFSWQDFASGVDRFCVGLGKKVLLANAAGEAARPFLDGDIQQLSVAGAWWGILLFGFQIYFDFSGYSDMAIGMGRMFGFHYHENFKYPYAARSATDFWRRWHISLGTFFRDYLYIPLGGNRQKFRMFFNLVFVWCLTGLWHGASWNFVLWGLMYGVLIAAEKALERLTSFQMPVVLGHAYLILVTLIGWTLFYFVDFHRMVQHLAVMFAATAAPLLDITTQISFLNEVVLVLLLAAACLPLFPWLADRLPRSSAGARVLTLWEGGGRAAVNVALVLASSAMLVGSSYNPFLYFRF